MKPFMRRLSEAVSEYRQGTARHREHEALLREHDAIMQDRGVAEDHLYASWRAQRAGEPGCPFCV